MNGPEDRCPYPRPFPADFKSCPAYLPRLLFATDTRGQRLKPSWTCAHLDTAQRENGGYYGQCLLGTREQRERWANAMAAGQLGAVRDARVALSEAIRPQLERLMRVVAGKDGVATTQTILVTRRNELGPAVVALEDAFESFVDGHPDLFRDAGIDPNQLVACFAEGMREFVSRPLVKEWRFDAEIVSRYPWPVIAFLRPDLVREVGLRPQPYE
jgi:hypothetical protein